MYGIVEKVVSEHFGIEPGAIRSGGRIRAVLDGRQFTWYILHSVLSYRATVIAQEYGVTKRNVLHAVSVIRDGIRLQPFYARHFSEIEKALQESGIEI